MTADGGRDGGGARLRLERTFATSPERVFAAWTEPEVLRRWFAAGPDWSSVGVEVDLRVGGRYRLSMTGPAGGTHTIVGEYLQVVRPELLVYTWRQDPSDSSAAADPTLVTVRFRAAPEGTTVLLTHTRFPAKRERDRHGDGWRACLDNLDRRVFASEQRPA